MKRKILTILALLLGLAGLGFERASDADCIAVFSSKRIFYLVQWKTQ